MNFVCLKLLDLFDCVPSHSGNVFSVNGQSDFGKYNCSQEHTTEVKVKSKSKVTFSESDSQIKKNPEVLKEVFNWYR